VNRRGWFLFAAMSVIWGIPYLFIKIAVEGVSVPVLVLARTRVGAAVPRGLRPVSVEFCLRVAIRASTTTLLQNSAQWSRRGA
jgi:hypothetical protein